MKMVKFSGLSKMAKLREIVALPNPTMIWSGTIVAFLFLASAAIAQSEHSVGDAKQLWQLLDYVAVDYSGAIENGAVISEAEYAEMLDFTENAIKQLQTLPDHSSKNDIAAAIEKLRSAVVNKADAVEVARLANDANARLIVAYPFPVAPKAIPDLARGHSLYATQCASCHGDSGDGNGPVAGSLEPRPIAFTDAERAGSRSVMALYQVISQGVEGTSMASYNALPEDDRWSLAFYIGSLSYDVAMRKRGEQLWRSDAESVRRRFPDLTTLTTTTQSAIAETIPADVARDVIAYLRTHPHIVEAHKPSDIALSRLRLNESLAALRAGDRENATKLGLSAYLDGFEPLEPVVAARDNALMIAVENAMLGYRSAVSKGSVEEAEAAAAQLDQLFARIDAEMGSSQADPTTTFVGAFTILLREGLEAILIVIGIMAFLKKAERHDVLPHVHAGWVSALVAGVLTWAVATYLVEISGASRELTEGIGGVVAAVVLLSVGLWMHQKSSADRWQIYIKDKLSAAMSRRSKWGLFGLAFLVVYREVFETVLFYSALAADGNGNALMAGFLTAALMLALIAWALLRTSARMPIGKFFSLTSILVAVLAVVLIGKGMSALQEAGWVGVNPIAVPRIELLGVYPTVETLVAQVIVLLIALGGFAFNVYTVRWQRRA